MKHAKVIAIAATLALTACGSQGEESDATPPDIAPSVAASMPPTVVDPAATATLRTFAGRDSDRDGFISSAENAAAADRIFDAVDTDHDGAVTAAEYTAARVALGLTTLPGSEELIAEADQDGDGKLTLAEWIGGEGKAFKDADKDPDEKLSRAEWDASARLAGAPQAVPSPSSAAN